MNAFASLSTTALLGTDRRPPEWLVLDGPMGELLGRIPRESVEKALLQTVGVLGTCQLAGMLPPKNDSAPSVAEDETTPQDGRTDLLAAILADGPERLQAEAFLKMAAAGRHLPHRLLPKALECGRRSVALRPSLLRVLGQRGAWLAAQNDAWSFAAGGGADILNDDIWQHGSLDQRRLYLLALRQQDAARARELVREVMTAEGAKERAAFIECLGTALSPEDEDLLGATLTDKSKEVRQLATRLLSTLPQSRYAQRMAGYATPLLKVEKKFLRGTVITLEAPAVYGAAWKADLIEEAKPKGHPMGERAWWLYQIVQRVPLVWWETQTGMNPAECLAWAQKSDWKDALLQGWAEAQAAQRRVEWAEAFLGIALPSNGPLTVFDLLETLPPTLREAHFLKLLRDHNPAVITLSGLIGGYLKRLPLDAPELTSTCASNVLRILKQHIRDGGGRNDWQLRQVLPELTCLFPASIFDQLLVGWEVKQTVLAGFTEAGKPRDSEVDDLIARIGIVLDQRKQLSL